MTLLLIFAILCIVACLDYSLTIKMWILPILYIGWISLGYSMPGSIAVGLPMLFPLIGYYAYLDEAKN